MRLHCSVQWLVARRRIGDQFVVSKVEWFIYSAQGKKQWKQRLTPSRAFIFQFWYQSDIEQIISIIV